MDQSIATTSTGPVHFLNIEYFFLGIYNLLHHTGVVGGGATDYAAVLSGIWVLYTVLAYLATFVFLIIFAYATIQLNDTKAAEHHLYETIEPVEAETTTEHHRWKHVASLVESAQESDWRQAIIEADIMLDDILATHGYVGATVGEKLKQADPKTFHTLRDAWDAHMVRNQIAHQGSAYQLTGQMAYRTVTKYRNVFEEFHAI